MDSGNLLDLLLLDDEGPLVLHHLLLLRLVQPLKLLHLILVPHLEGNFSNSSSLRPREWLSTSSSSRHLALAEDIVGSLPHTSPSLAVPRSPGPGNQGEVGDEDGDGGVPEQLVVDQDGIDKVESD